MTEKTKVVAPCLKLIRARGGKALKLQPQPSSGIETGTPDIIASYRGICLLIECKLTSDHKPSTPQRKRLGEWTRSGALCLCLWDVTYLEKIFDLIDAFFSRQNHPTMNAIIYDLVSITNQIGGELIAYVAQKHGDIN